MTEFIIFALIASLGMIVQSVVGFAGALVAIPLFALTMPPRDAVPAYCVLMQVVSIYLVRESRRHVDWRSVRGLLIGGLPGVLIGALGLKYLPLAVIGTTISAVTLLFGVFFLSGMRVRIPDHPASELIVGLLSGLLGAIVGSGPPVIVYGLARGWPKEVFRGSLLAYFFCLGATGVISYAALGLLSRHWLLLAAGSTPPALAAAWLGIQLKQRASEKTFRLIVLITVIAVGLVGLVKYLR